MMANGGELDGVRILKPETVKMMTTLHELPDGTGGRGYGVDMTSAFRLQPRRSISQGHELRAHRLDGHERLDRPGQ